MLLPLTAVGMEFNDVQVTSSGLKAVNNSWHWHLNITGYGYGSTLQPISVGEKVINGKRIEYRRGNLTEWYVEDERGVEQGFTLQSRPQSHDKSSLRVEMALETNLTPELISDNQAIAFTDKTGKVLLNYDKLKVLLNYDKLYVFDANNKKMPAHFSMVDSATIGLTH